MPTRAAADHDKPQGVYTPSTPSRSRKIRKTLILFCSTFDIEGHNLPRRSIWKFDSGMFRDVQDSFWLPPKESKLKFKKKLLLRLAQQLYEIPTKQPLSLIPSVPSLVNSFFSRPPFPGAVQSCQLPWPLGWGWRLISSHRAIWGS